MRKVVVNRHGGPEVLEQVLVPAPSVRAGELLVDLVAAGVNYLDVYQRNGSVPTSRPFTPGFEGVGVVRAVGGVSPFRPGERVAWINVLGSYADQVIVPIEQAIRIPESFATEQALLFQAVSAQYLLARPPRNECDRLTPSEHEPAPGRGGTRAHQHRGHAAPLRESGGSRPGTSGSRDSRASAEEPIPKPIQNFWTGRERR